LHTKQCNVLHGVKQGTKIQPIGEIVNLNPVRVRGWAPLANHPMLEKTDKPPQKYPFWYKLQKIIGVGLLCLAGAIILFRLAQAGWNYLH